MLITTARLSAIIVCCFGRLSTKYSTHQTVFNRVYRPSYNRTRFPAPITSRWNQSHINTMTAATEAGWGKLGTPAEELRLEFTLPTGQSFRWRETSPGIFLGVLGQRAVLLRQLQDDVAYKVLSRGSGAHPGDDFDAIADYFNLSVSLATLSKEWCAADEHYAKLSTALPGARMLRQDPVECLFSFICSQNNHISRIHGMVNRLCELYGEQLPLKRDALSEEEAGLVDVSQPLYAFPTLEQLARATEEELRDAGFGYRARYIVGAVQQLNEMPEGGKAWLLSLRNVPFDQACEALCTLPGVGPKVAACAALFSLDKHSSIPVDVHMWQVAIRRYTPHLRNKTLTPKLHAEVQAAFVKVFGPYAGWAHNSLFIAELGSMKSKIAAARGKHTDSDSEFESETESEDQGLAVDETAPVTPPLVAKTAAVDVDDGRPEKRRRMPARRAKQYAKVSDGEVSA